MLKKLKVRTTFEPSVIIPSLIFIVLVTISCIIWPYQSQQWLGNIKQMVYYRFSWFYILTVSVFIGVLLLMALSRIGDIRLGRDEEEPEFPFLSWVAMLFAAGMGVGLMFFGVAEPMIHSSNPIETGGVDENTRNALLYTFFHWGIHPWTIYGMISLALAYFGFRYHLPLSIRSLFFPILKDKINGPFGAFIDVVALCTTLFGIITTLGYGAMQLNVGLSQVGIYEVGTNTTRNVIIVVVVGAALLSAISGVGRGVRRLSEFNLILAIGLMLFVLCTGPTIHLLSAFSENIGYYLSNVIYISFKTFAYDAGHQDWFFDWTIVYWAWWFSWAPFVGLFVARISRGRTIREFIFGVLIVPSLFNLLWFTIFGNSAIWVDEYLAGGALSQITAPEEMLYAFLNYLPLPQLLGVMATLILTLFFITSADSGILVMNSIASNGQFRAIPRWQTFMWGVILIGLSIALLNSDGLAAVQSMTLLVALPFAALMLLMCYSLWKALSIDTAYYNTRMNPSSVFWNGQDWEARLDRILTQTQRADMFAFLQNQVRPAMEELSQKLQERGLVSRINAYNDDEQHAVELRISSQSMRDFIYGVRTVAQTIHNDLIDDRQLPNVQYEESYFTETYFADGRQGYDIQYLSRGEIISDILKQYQRYLYLITDENNRLLTKMRRRRRD